MDLNNVDSSEQKTNKKAEQKEQEQEVKTTKSIDKANSLAQKDSKKKDKTKLAIVLGTIFALLLIIGGGLALYYSLIYQNPNKIINDALIGSFKNNNHIKAKITSDITLSQNPRLILKNLEIETYTDKDHKTENKINASLALNKQDFNVKANIQTEKDKAYFKLDNLDSLVEILLKNMKLPDSAINSAKKELQSLSKKWIVIDQKTKGKNSCQTEFITDVLSSDKKEFKKAFEKNKFIQAKDKKDGKNGLIGVNFEFNKNNYKSFIDAVSQTNQVNKLKSCLKETTTKDPEKVFSDLKKDIDNLENLSGTIWATKFGHKLEAIDFSLNVKDKANKKSTLNGNFEFNTETKPIDIPKDTINTQEFLKELQNAVFKGLYAKNG
mgnify:FL=1